MLNTPLSVRSAPGPALPLSALRAEVLRSGSAPPALGKVLLFGELGRFARVEPDALAAPRREPLPAAIAAFAGAAP